MRGEEDCNAYIGRGQPVARPEGDRPPCRPLGGDRPPISRQRRASRDLNGKKIEGT